MPDASVGCRDWAACYLAPFLGLMLGSWAIPESLLLGIIALGFGMASRRWTRAAAAGFVVGILAVGMHYWIRSTMEPPFYDPAATTRLLEKQSVPIITGGVIIALIGWLIGRGFALLRQSNKVASGPLPKL